MAGSQKANVSADIGQELIDEALRSVEKRTTPVAGAEPPADAPAAEPGEVPQEWSEGEPATAAEAAPVAEELEALKAQLEFSLAKGRELMDKLKDEHERTLRAAADLENFKKRAAKEKEEVQRYGVEKLLRDFFPVADNLDRALEHAHSATDFESLVKGIRMTRKLFEDTLGRHGVKGFSAKGMPFDPRLHEAMQQAETSDMPPNHVFAEVLRGYTLNDRLVRPALVVVSKAPQAVVDGTGASGGAVGETKSGGEGGGGDSSGRPQGE